MRTSATVAPLCQQLPHEQVGLYRNQEVVPKAASTSLWPKWGITPPNGPGALPWESPASRTGACSSAAAPRFAAQPPTVRAGLPSKSQCGVGACRRQPTSPVPATKLAAGCTLCAKRWLDSTPVAPAHPPGCEKPLPVAFNPSDARTQRN